MAIVVLLYDALDRDHAALYISVLVAADVFVLVVFVWHQVDRVMVRPLREAISTAEAIASGDLQRRLAPGDTIEMANLAASFNRMTDRLLEERAHLVRAEKMASVGRLAAGIAHEIGNPLGAINGYLHLLRASDAAGAQEALAGLEREAARIDRIVRGLLDYARPSRRATGAVDLNDVGAGVIDLLMAQGVLRNLELEFSPAAEPARVMGDRHDFEQVLVNLLLNAVDAMSGRGSLALIVRRATRSEILGGARRVSDPAGRPASAPNARVVRWLESSATDQIAMVAVTDSGPGVPAADVEHVFDPFYTTKEPGLGTGLGLAIVARTVENAGGTIWVSSSREGGAAFRMLLPLASAGAEARPSTPADPAPRHAPQASRA